MGIFDTLVFGIQLWIWFSVVGSFVFMIAVFVFTSDKYTELAKKAYFIMRHPERTVRVIMHHKSGFYKVYWRLIPDKNLFRINKKDYIFDRGVITKEHDIFIAKGKGKKQMLLVVKNVLSKKKGNKEIFKIGDTKEYEFNKIFAIQEKGKKFPEIHYVYNSPFPLKFDFTDDEIKFSAQSLTTFKENDLFEKLLRLKGERQMLSFLVLLVMINLGASIFLISKQMGWF